MIWIARNHKVFCNELRNEIQIKTLIWEAILDYGRIAWQHTQDLIAKTTVQQKKSSLLRKFDATWMRKGVFGTRHGQDIKWDLKAIDFVNW